MLPLHEQAAPSARIVGRQEVSVERLDTQGSEEQVIAGCGDRLADVCGLQLEMSLEPLYDGQKLFADTFEMVTSRGFKIVDVAPEFADPHTAGPCCRSTGGSCVRRCLRPESPSPGPRRSTPGCGSERPARLPP